ncbi:uncharacterized protein K452DRAFT_314555 [Aplosporella prunicola CBS 121167]|uniref:F-box domain-containing protein n=1 Tax=Aplosporella prunicola CBS 121167 TaxID=1176127 RepID=A0A6A6BVL4_9PEZI|nr:uncharacterized protein K452DRAFT_314555 [Aplosporella prunicola CBS 121167]KAF2147383.1 hypothetical protein K452DRAFT_314555 [Aplosporella prunicola CBS 121167]
MVHYKFSKSLWRVLPHRKISILEDFLQPRVGLGIIDNVLWSYNRAFDLSFPAKLVRSFLSSSDLLALRVTSKALKAWVEGSINVFYSKAFRTLYIDGHYGMSGQQYRPLSPLTNIATYCRHLVIRLADALPTLHSPHQESTATPPVTILQDRWTRLFKQLPHLTHLTISSPGSATWPVLSLLEAQLLALRLALESSTLTHLRSLRLHPIHPIGLTLLRWQNGAAYISAPWTAVPFWRSLQTLDIRLLNPLPGGVNAMTKRDFLKSLQGYLAAFRHTLRVLRFAWVGAPGPNPLLLDALYGGRNFSAPAIVWESLLELVLENVRVRVRDWEEVERRTGAVGFVMRGESE